MSDALGKSITIEQAALLLGISSRTVRRWIADGLLAAEPAAGRAKKYRVSAVYEAERAVRNLGSRRDPDAVS